MTVAFQGDYGKPRPALVVQSDTFMGYFSITLLPISSDLKDAEFFRIDVAPTAENAFAWLLRSWSTR